MPNPLRGLARLLWCRLLNRHQSPKQVRYIGRSPAGICPRCERLVRMDIVGDWEAWDQ